MNIRVLRAMKLLKPPATKEEVITVHRDWASCTMNYQCLPTKQELLTTLLQSLPGSLRQRQPVVNLYVEYEYMLLAGKGLITTSTQQTET